MLTPFLIIGGIGLVVLLISMILGDIFDHLEIGDGAISGTALGVAAVVFGASGALALSSGLELMWGYVIAGALAIAAYVVALLLIRKLSKSSDGVPMSTIGLTGVSRSDISAAGGEVSLDGPHEIERRLAYSEAAIPEGVRIRVVEHSGTRVKVVAEHGTEYRAAE